MLESLCIEKIFTRIYNKYVKDLHNFLYYKYGSQADINDIVQDAFMQLWRNCQKVLPEKAKGFLFKVASNTMLNKFKHDKVVLNYQKLIPNEINHESPDFLLEEEEFYKKYQYALSQLTDEQRVAFLLNKIEDKKHKEIAEIMNISQKAVEYRIYTAFKIIKETLEKN
jgi:RNA polymerase sigma-70 factor (ECF subfamily)